MGTQLSLQQNIVYVNGNYVADVDARVSIFDRGFLFGDGVYEVVPVLNSALVDKEYFLQRLKRSLDELKIPQYCSDEDLLFILRELVKLNGVVEGLVYMQVTRGVALGRTFQFPSPSITPTMTAFSQKSYFKQNPAFKTGINVVSVPDIRWKRRDVKSLQLLGQVMGKQEAHSAGAVEGWMTEDGYVTEGCSSTAFIVKGNTVITRPLSNSILPGVRRRTLIEIIQAHDTFVLQERKFTLEEACKADEAFICSATSIVVPVVGIDGVTVCKGMPGPVADALRALYFAVLEKESKE